MIGVSTPRETRTWNCPSNATGRGGVMSIVAVPIDNSAPQAISRSIFALKRTNPVAHTQHKRVTIGLLERANHGAIMTHPRPKTKGVHALVHINERAGWCISSDELPRSGTGSGGARYRNGNAELPPTTRPP